jgi:hypothetical protein
MFANPTEHDPFYFCICPILSPPSTLQSMKPTNDNETVRTNLSSLRRLPSSFRLRSLLFTSASFNPSPKLFSHTPPTLLDLPKYTVPTSLTRLQSANGFSSDPAARPSQVRLSKPQAKAIALSSTATASKSPFIYSTLAESLDPTDTLLDPRTPAPEGCPAVVSLNSLSRATSSHPISLNMSPALSYISSSVARVSLPQPQLSPSVLEWIVRSERPKRGPVHFWIGSESGTGRGRVDGGVSRRRKGYSDSRRVRDLLLERRQGRAGQRGLQGLPLRSITRKANDRLSFSVSCAFSRCDEMTFHAAFTA